MMCQQWVNNFSKILASLFVIANLAISLDYFPDVETYPKTYRTELLVLKEGAVHQSIRFDTAHELLQIAYVAKSYGSISHSERTLLAQTKDSLGFKIQQHSALEIKPLLLKIVLNDIVQQKSHWI